MINIISTFGNLHSSWAAWLLWWYTTVVCSSYVFEKVNI